MSDRRVRVGVPTTENDALSHALAMVVTPLILGLFGVWLDNVLGTGWVFAAILVAMGVIGAFLSAYYRYQAQMAEQDAGKPWTRRARRSDGATG